MGKMNLKGLVCLGRYQRFDEDTSSIGSTCDISSNISYNCGHCGHHGTVKAEVYNGKRRADKNVQLNNSSSSSSLGSEKFILGKSCNSAVKSVVNDLGLSNSSTTSPSNNNNNNTTNQNITAKNTTKKYTDKNCTLMRKLLGLKKDENELLSSSSPYLNKLNEDWNDSVSLENAAWYRPGFDRDLTNQHLSNLSTGSFVVRRSKSRRDALALSLKTPSRHISTLSNRIAHFLILVLPNGDGFRIKGSKKTFPSLRSLIIHHSVMSEILPCPLLLPFPRHNHLHQMGCGSENASESSETDEEDSHHDEDIADISNYPDLLITLRQTLYATQDLPN
uniref:SH2 domain-containing protein n=1 Tax=Lepeophtheirus salmonis TaxID=72036 RepID=A0A0K2UJA6_LEPSM